MTPQETLAPAPQWLHDPGIPPVDAAAFAAIGKLHTLVTPLVAHGRVLAGSRGAPEDAPAGLPGTTAARRVEPLEAWVPESWRVLATELAVAPLTADTTVLLGRPSPVNRHLPWVPRSCLRRLTRRLFPYGRWQDSALRPSGPAVASGHDRKQSIA